MSGEILTSVLKKEILARLRLCSPRRPRDMSSICCCFDDRFVACLLRYLTKRLWVMLPDQAFVGHSQVADPHAEGVTAASGPYAGQPHPMSSEAYQQGQNKTFQVPMKCACFGCDASDAAIVPM